MEARPCQIVEFFNGSKQMLVPLFQRPYEWKEQHWETLWNDLLERYERADVPTDVSHFTGAIVTAPAKSIPVGVNKYLIIDGQQRLTTVTVLLLAMRSLVAPDSKEYRKITKLLINDDEDGPDFFKLMPTQPDRAAFQALLKDEKTAPESQFRAAYRFFRNMLQGADSDGCAIDVWRMFETLQARLHVVMIHLGDADDPYLIFESLNAKGSPLTQADLVRNYLLLRLHMHEQQKAYDGHWLPMQTRLGEHLTEFMRVYLMMDGDEVAKGEVYAVLKRRLQETPDASVAVEIARMNAASASYMCIVEPTREPDPELRRGLQRLLRWDVTTSHPLLLALYESFRVGQLPLDEFIECVHMIESFAVRRTVCAVPTNQLKRIFLSLTKHAKGAGTAEAIRGALAGGSAGRRWPKDDEFREGWIKFRAYANPVDRCKFILESLEESFEHKEPASFDKATIEHVMPQTLSAGWTAALGKDAEEIHERWVDTIGNLTLTGYNPELSNSAFADKQPLLAESHFGLNKHFGTVTAWTPTEVQARANVLWERARAIWSRPGADSQA